MSLAYKFRKAEGLLEKIESGDRNELLRICHRIRDAQEALLAAAGEQMERCINRCEGICCRNIELDPIISHWDLLYILSLAPQIRPHILVCLLNEDPLYRTDCIFLTDGMGPCIFPAKIRPEVCVATFCQNDRSIRREIQQVKRLFIRLSWFVRWSILRTKLRKLKKAVTAAFSRMHNTS